MLMQDQLPTTSPFRDSLDTLYQGIAGQDNLKSLRAKAWDRFSELGLPTRKTEVFGYLRLKALYELELSDSKTQSVDKAAIEQAIYPECKESVIVFVNGRYVPELSCLDAMPKSLVASELNQAIRPYGTFLNNRWTRSTKAEMDPFAVLNGAMHQGGLLLYLPPKTVVENSLQILHVVDTESPSALLMPRVQLFIGSQSELKLATETLCLRGESFVVNDVLDVALDDAARLQVSRVMHNPPESSYHFHAFRASLKRDSHLKTLSFTDGAKSVREDYRVALTGENGEVDLNGAWTLCDRREAHVNVLVEHEAPHCRSNQLFKGILNHHSRSSFEGKIYVQPEAQQTDAFQLNNNLLLGERAEAYSKPNLEIFADDVKASHGSTVGQLDEEPLFYLRTRGLSKGEASALLVKGFIKDLLDEIPLPSQQLATRTQVQELLRRVMTEAEAHGDSDQD